MTDPAAEPSGSDQRTRRSLLAAAGAGAVTSIAGCAQITTPADVAAATEPPSGLRYFVGASWLANHRDEVVVLDARQQRFFRAERIYGARRVPLDAVSQRTVTEAGAMPAFDRIATAVSDLGVSPADDIVVYGSSVGARVSRTVYALQLIGHAGDIHVLNGGFEAWTGRVGTGPAGTPDSVQYSASRQSSGWVTKEWIAERIGEFNEGGPGLIDTRQKAAFLGEQVSSGTDRPGHLPGAINVYWLGNIRGREIAPPGDLFQLYNGEAGLSEDGPVIIYSTENVEATQTWLALRSIGFEDVRVYEGGYTEWAAQTDHSGRYPVETATGAVIDTKTETASSDGSNFTCN